MNDLSFNTVYVHIGIYTCVHMQGSEINPGYLLSSLSTLFFGYRLFP